MANTSGNLNALDKILIVGYGSIGARHAKIARTLLPTADIRILSKHITSAPEYFNGVFSELADALCFKPNISVICSPSNDHLYFANAFSNIGSNLLVEKPISDGALGVSELIKKCTKKYLVLQIGYNLRYFDSLTKLKALIEEKAIGEIYSAHIEVGQFLPDWRKNMDYRKSVSASRAKGGGVLLELSHEFDYLMWIFGDPNRVMAISDKLSLLELDVEDSAKIILEIPRGHGSPNKTLISVNMDFCRRNTERACVIVGSGGSLRWSFSKNSIETYFPGDHDWKEAYSSVQKIDDTYYKQWEFFINCIEKKIFLSESGVAALKVLNLIDAIKRSSIHECKVEIKV